MEVGIVILPNEPVATQAIELSQSISNGERAKFTLNKINFLPHITLFHGVFDQEKLEDVALIIRAILNETQIFDINLSGYSHLLGYIFWDAEKTKELLNLHKEIVEKLSAHTNGMRPEFVEMLKTKSVSPKRLEYIEKYGYPLCFEEFIPHITLTRLKNKENYSSEKVVESLPEVSRSFSLNQIGVVEIGEHGSCKKILKSICKNN